MTAAVYFHPDGYTTGGPRLMGRNAAGESFLRGYFAYSRDAELWARVEEAAHEKVLAQIAQQAGCAKPLRFVGKEALGMLSKPGVLYYPGPDIGKQAWQRAAFGHGSWSLCGVTHTTASAGAMDAITEWITAPVQTWDAVICTSQAVRDNVQHLLQAQADYLAQRLGVQRLVLPLLPVIPLGIHTRDFAFNAKQRKAARAALGADGKTLVVLFMGRLSFHGKAHPLAMYQALQKAAANLDKGQRILLVECGWHANEFIENAFRAGAQAACPDVRVVTLDGRKAEDRQTAWAGADVFCSLSDNIQETFGIAPVEAMAAGLPLVVSDWDGYRDTVRDGVDGFRIPTLMPQAGLGGDLALRHALGVDTYDAYCGNACSFVAVDVEKTAQAFSSLFASEELRRGLGEAGRKRAQEVYDWEKIIPQYEALWAQQSALRKEQGGKLSALRHPWPARMDPFAAFASYPSQSLDRNTLLALADADAAALLVKWRGLDMVSFARNVLPSEDELQVLLGALADKPQAAGDLVRGIPASRQDIALRALAWLVKLGVARVCSQEGCGGD